MYLIMLFSGQTPRKNVSLGYKPMLDELMDEDFEREQLEK
jgi:hypothetical protein